MRSVKVLAFTGSLCLVFAGAAFSGSGYDQVCSNYAVSANCKGVVGCAAANGKCSSGGVFVVYNATNYQTSQIGTCIRKVGGGYCDDTIGQQVCSTTYYASGTTPPICGAGSLLGCTAAITNDTGCK